MLSTFSFVLSFSWVSRASFVDRFTIIFLPVTVKRGLRVLCGMRKRRARRRRRRRRRWRRRRSWTDGKVFSYRFTQNNCLLWLTKYLQWVLDEFPANFWRISGEFPECYWHFPAFILVRASSFPSAILPSPPPPPPPKKENEFFLIRVDRKKEYWKRSPWGTLLQSVPEILHPALVNIWIYVYIFI